ncbi:WbqC family protein [Janthinobacterium sp. HLX7-2]|uniref:WbqC family protein n=1 Tax=Janthinobacterium sp. HLX7-2 TaxID=1259331 RepID=UPI003F23072B
MTTLAIMQPYFLPYLGYFQLLAAVDKFVLFDDVNYIQRGWINRNRLLMNGAAHIFTVPLRGASQNRLICDITLLEERAWRDKLLRTLRQAYARAPYYRVVAELLERVISHPTLRLDHFLLNSLREVMSYLSLETELINTSRVYGNASLSGQDRILDICIKEHATCYINPIGGTALYQRETFLQHGIALQYLQARPISYPQGKNLPVSGLSIVDVLMYNSIPVVQQFLIEKDLV